MSAAFSCCPTRPTGGPCWKVAKASGDWSYNAPAEAAVPIFQFHPYEVDRRGECASTVVDCYGEYRLDTVTCSLKIRFCDAQANARRAVRGWTREAAPAKAMVRARRGQFWIRFFYDKKMACGYTGDEKIKTEFLDSASQARANESERTCLACQSEPK